MLLIADVEEGACISSFLVKFELAPFVNEPIKLIGYDGRHRATDFSLKL